MCQQNIQFSFSLICHVIAHPACRKCLTFEECRALAPCLPAVAKEARCASEIAKKGTSSFFEVDAKNALSDRRDESLEMQEFCDSEESK